MIRIFQLTWKHLGLIKLELIQMFECKSICAKIKKTKLKYFVAYKKGITSWYLAQQWSEPNL